MSKIKSFFNADESLCNKWKLGNNPSGFADTEEKNNTLGNIISFDEQARDIQANYEALRMRDAGKKKNFNKTVFGIKIMVLKTRKYVFVRKKIRVNSNRLRPKYLAICDTIFQ